MLSDKEMLGRTKEDRELVMEKGPDMLFIMLIALCVLAKIKPKDLAKVMVDGGESTDKFAREFVDESTKQQNQKKDLLEETESESKLEE